jgi:NDP-sugar pyrophosphorylase family protein
MKPTLLVLAAGMGSRYGKLKQLDAFGPSGETIIDYSLHDAIQAGFGKVVFIIRDFFREEFESYFRGKLDGRIEVSFVSQELHDLPAGLTPPDDRTKPWGTAHAVWVARNEISVPFGVINADDYYGVASFKQLADFLETVHLSESPDYAVIAYYLRNTLSDHGTVNRGVCNVDSGGHLVSVKECVKIARGEDGVISYPSGDIRVALSDETLVSMNMWGFQPSFFDHSNNIIHQFLQDSGMKEGAEIYIPTVIDSLIKNNVLNVKVIDTESDWFGVTYQEDKPFVMQKIQQLISEGVYPENLWS